MLKNFIRAIERIFVAISFAEEGEFDTARQIIGERNKDRQRKRVRPEQIKRTQMRA